MIGVPGSLNEIRAQRLNFFAGPGFYLSSCWEASWMLFQSWGGAAYVDIGYTGCDWVVVVCVCVG